MPTTNKIKSLGGRFVLQMGKSPSATNLLLPDTVVYLNGNLTAELDQPKIWTHVVQAVSRNVFDELNELANTESSTKVWIRFGIEDGSKSVYTDWEPQQLISVKTQPSNTPTVKHGFRLTIITADLIYAMTTDNKLVARKGKISDMVRAIATESGFDKFAIESTQHDFSLIQSFQTNYEFAKDRLLKLASTSEGSSGYSMFAKAGFLHFHTFNYQQSEIYEFEYGAPSSTLTDMSFTNLVHAAKNTTASGVTLIAYDPLTGKTTVWETQADKELILANSTPTLESANYLQRHVGQNQLLSLYAQAQRKYADAKNDFMESVIMVDNYPFIGVFDLVSASFVNGEGDPWSGLYYVKKVSHIVENGSVTSVYTLMRGEYVSDDGTATGRSVNYAEAGSSRLTNSSSGDFGSLSGNVVSVNSPATQLIPPPGA